MANEQTNSSEGDPESTSTVKGDGINISGIGGDVIGVEVRGSGNIIGKNIAVGSVSIDEQQLQKIPKEYVDSLKAFIDALNRHFKTNNVPSDKVAEVQRNVIGPNLYSDDIFQLSLQSEISLLCWVIDN